VSQKFQIAFIPLNKKVTFTAKGYPNNCSNTCFKNVEEAEIKIIQQRQLLSQEKAPNILNLNQA
jgi:hypothetical protein